MEHPIGETLEAGLQVAFDRRLELELHGSRITSDAGLLAVGELDDMLGLSTITGEMLASPGPVRTAAIPRSRSSAKQSS